MAIDYYYRLLEIMTVYFIDYYVGLATCYYVQSWGIRIYMYMYTNI